MIINAGIIKVLLNKNFADRVNCFIVIDKHEINTDHNTRNKRT